MSKKQVTVRLDTELVDRLDASKGGRAAEIQRLVGLLDMALDAQRRGYDALVTEILLRELDRTNPRGNGNGVIQ